MNYDAFVKSNLSNIKFVPKEHQTEELCLHVVSANGYYLRFIDAQTPNIVLKAFETNDSSGKFIKLTDSQWEEALQKMEH